MPFTVRSSSIVNLSTGEQSFVTSQSLPTLDAARDYYKKVTAAFSERATHPIKVEIINPYSVTIQAMYIPPKRKEASVTLKAKKLKKEPRPIQQFRSGEVKAMLTLFDVLKNLYTRHEKLLDAQTQSAFTRIFEFIDSISPRLHQAVDRKDPVVQITYAVGSE